MEKLTNSFEMTSSMPIKAKFDGFIRFTVVFSDKMKVKFLGGNKTSQTRIFSGYNLNNFKLRIVQTSITRFAFPILVILFSKI